MTRRPKTLDEVDWEGAADAFVKAARNMTLSEIIAQAQVGEAWFESRGDAENAEVYRRVAAILQRRLLN